MDYGFAILLGFLGSLHCAAMCGPLQLALPVPPGGAGRLVFARLLYQAARIVTYCLLGVFAGAIGKSLFLVGAQRWLSIGLGLVILTGFLISKKIVFHGPVVRLVSRLKFAMSSQLRQRTFRATALLGLLNGLLPCGLVYVATAGAVSQGTVFGAILWMAAFGLGTVPMLLGISLSGRLIPIFVRLRYRGFTTAGVCVLASLLILRGLALGIPYVSPGLVNGSLGSCCGH